MCCDNVRHTVSSYIPMSGKNVRNRLMVGMYCTIIIIQYFYCHMLI